MPRPVKVRQKFASHRGLLAALLCGLVRFACAEELEEARQHFLTGQYEECLRVCAMPEVEGRRDYEWPFLHAQALLAVGRYVEAEVVVSNALSVSTGNIQLRMLGVDTAKASGNPGLAVLRLREINELAGARPWAYRDPSDLLVLGQAALLLGADPKVVLERLFGPAQKADPKLRELYLARGELALDKHDYALAAKTFAEALKKFPDDADILCGQARAYAPSARGKMLALLEMALKNNENHVPSLLQLANHLIDAEEYVGAGATLSRALKVNPWHPEAWAYQAVLAHLRGDSTGETEAREKALRFWRQNPLVDHLIGLKLSQKYRFAEGATCQRQSLVFDPDFLPAQIQLAEDLLRLGVEAEGWQLATEVNRRDGYNVTAYNLVALRGTMQKFQTITNGDFVLRMSPHEAALYGDRALGLLTRAKARLTEKYDITLASPTLIEIFPEQKDFAVRTFGMPDNPGFLGVCFGRVVTVNSPASQGGDPANWEAVLWHEFCHVVTLQLTKNKMPRWLSEGLSVYEELQANPTWGQTMNPRYREMVLGADLTPVSELSAAFLTPKSDLHVQFAYYQSALVIEYLAGKFGFDNLKAILRDLAHGVDINDAIAQHTAPMKQIEKDFAAFANAKAEALGPGLDWKKPESIRSRRREEVDILHLPDSTNPPPHIVGYNYWTLLEQATKSISEKNWEAAKGPLNTLIELYPAQSGPNNAYALLAAAHRGLNEAEPERTALENWATRDAAAPDAYLRLMELAEAVRDWKAVTQNAERFLAVNPLMPQPYRFLGRASEELGDTPQAIGAYQRILLLDPPDPAVVHFQLATLLHNRNDPAAKRHALQALEEAPRFRAAHRLLWELASAPAKGNNSSPASDQLQSQPSP